MTPTLTLCRWIERDLPNSPEDLVEFLFSFLYPRGLEKASNVVIPWEREESMSPVVDAGRGHRLMLNGIWQPCTP